MNALERSERLRDLLGRVEDPELREALTALLRRSGEMPTQVQILRRLFGNEGVETLAMIVQMLLYIQNAAKTGSEMRDHFERLYRESMLSTARERRSVEHLHHLHNFPEQPVVPPPTERFAEVDLPDGRTVTFCQLTGDSADE